jgi:hypothetical protein
MGVPLHVHAFRKLLVQETDETKRQMLFLSLAQEEAKLKALLRELSAKCGHAARYTHHQGGDQAPPAKDDL